MRSFIPRKHRSTTSSLRPSFNPEPVTPPTFVHVRSCVSLSSNLSVNSCQSKNSQSESLQPSQLKQIDSDQQHNKTTWLPRMLERLLIWNCGDFPTCSKHRFQQGEEGKTLPFDYTHHADLLRDGQKIVIPPERIIPLIDESIQDHQRRLTDARSKSCSETIEESMDDTK